MNSTLKSLLFWMVLIVVGILIWNFSTIYQRSEAPIPFSQFLQDLDKGEVASVVITGATWAPASTSRRHRSTAL